MEEPLPDLVLDFPFFGFGGGAPTPQTPFTGGGLPPCPTSSTFSSASGIPINRLFDRDLLKSPINSGPGAGAPPHVNGGVWGGAPPEEFSTYYLHSGPGPRNNLNLNRTFSVESNLFMEMPCYGIT